MGPKASEFRTQAQKLSQKSLRPGPLPTSDKEGSPQIAHSTGEVCAGWQRLDPEATLGR